VMGWMDMWEAPMPSKKEGWAGSLTLPRELTIDTQGHLLQTPIAELTSLRGEETAIAASRLDNEQRLLLPKAEAVELMVSWEGAASHAERYGLRLGKGKMIFHRDYLVVILREATLRLWLSPLSKKLDSRVKKKTTPASII